MGHIFAGVTYYKATGKRKLLDIMPLFESYRHCNQEPGKKKGYPGHQEIELAL